MTVHRFCFTREVRCTGKRGRGELRAEVCREGGGGVAGESVQQGGVVVAEEDAVVAVRQHGGRGWLEDLVTMTT